VNGFIQSSVTGSDMVNYREYSIKVSDEDWLDINEEGDTAGPPFVIMFY
jgi:hypothetical protein